MTVYSSIISIFNWSSRLHESFSRSNKKQSSWSFFVLFPAADFIAKILEMIFVIKPLFYTLVLFKYSTPEIKGPTPRCQAWLIYIYCKHPKHWFEWLCRFAREILDTLRGKLKTWIGKKNLAPKRMSSKQCCGWRDSKLINLRCQEMIGHPNLTTKVSQVPLLGSRHSSHLFYLGSIG